MTAMPNDDLFDEFLERRGHDINPPGWLTDYNKKQCPECRGLHDKSAISCSVCGWSPR